MNINAAHGVIREKCIGMKFFQMTIIALCEEKDFVMCRCDCGKECKRRLYAIKIGECKSCGCIRGQSHGKSRNPEWVPTYNSWNCMKLRCNNPNNENFKRYGGRGIKVCKRWMDSFDLFIEDMGKRPIGCTLDRVDVNGMYCPENCRWATQREQDTNKRRTIWVVVDGKRMSVKDACSLHGLKYYNIIYHARKKTHQGAIDDALSKKASEG